MALKLSEAIVLGAVLGPQVRRAIAGVNAGTCALGAACAALGLGEDVRRLEWIFPRLKQVVPEEGRTLSSLIVEMNDRRYLTREQIAEQLVTNGWDCEAREVAAATASVVPRETVSHIS